MHYYKRNLGDYAKKAGRLTMLQHGAYNLLIDACYDRERFPTRDEAIDWAWAASAAEIEAVEFVLRKFFTLVEGVYVQERIRQELEDFATKSAKNKQIAHDRETKRARNVDEASPVVDDSSPNQEPVTNKDQERMSPDKPTTNDARLAEVTDEAMTAYNATLAEPLSLPKAMPVGIDKKRGYVRRSLKTIREVCRAAYGSEIIVPEFWADYFAALAADDFIAGRTGRPKEHANWRPDFEYVTRPEVIAKAFERAAA